MTSDSPDDPSRATRVRSGPAYQRRSVWVPETREVRSELPDPPADEPPPLAPDPEPEPAMAPRAGTPRSARCTTVPDRPSRRAFWTSTRSWAAVRGGRGESAWAEITPAAPAPPTTATTATPGTAHRRAGWVLKMLMATSCATWAESALRDPDPGSPAVAGWGRETAGGGGRGAAGGGGCPEVRRARALHRGLTAEGFVVDVVHDGPSGLRAARHGDYDAVVLDVMLPGMSGYDVVRTRRTEGVWAPVLMLSAKDGEYDQADGLDYGADDYLTKPFSFVVLLARLRALVRRRLPERPTVLSAGEVSLDPATHQVHVAREPVALTPREYTVLEYFLRNPHRVVSKTELLDHVWDAAEDTDPNAVEVYIGYLRRKLGRDLLQTVRGVGYRLAP